VKRSAGRIVRCRAAEARAQAGWITEMEPWRGLGYQAPSLGRWLGRVAREHTVWVARGATEPKRAKALAASRGVLGVVVVETPFLLGGFVALLAVRAAVAGQGIGRALLARVERQLFVDGGKRWLYVSADQRNRAALRFYRAMGFTRVGRLPDLIRAGRVEILLRKGAVGDRRARG
jgi:ribosomal protein S18 acetylase RimI-like enzyme